MEEKLCLKWNDFQQNVTSCFPDLRGDQDFVDVTLVCGDRTFEAHKVILSASSPFLRSLLKKTNRHPHLLVYMNGLLPRVLEAMLDFIYQGEANIVQDDLEGFLLIAEEFQLKGLTGNDEKSAQPPKSNFTGAQSMNSTISANKTESKYEFNRNSNFSESKFLDNTPSGGSYGTLIPAESNANKLVHIGEETARQVAALIERRDKFWTCARCEFKSLNKSHLKEHVENHIEGLEYPCNYCSKIMRSSYSFRKHIMNSHK